MNYNIENVPLPIGRQNTLTATIRKLNVGQSFLIPNDKITDNTQKGIYTIARAIGRSVTTRSVDDGLRVWRVDDQIENEAETVTDEPLALPEDRQSKIAALREMIESKPSVSEPETETWRFTSDKARQDEQTGDWYRQQYLGKRKRTVQVDEDDTEKVLRIV